MLERLLLYKATAAGCKGASQGRKQDDEDAQGHAPKEFENGSSSRGGIPERRDDPAILGLFSVLSEEVSTETPRVAIAAAPAPTEEEVRRAFRLNPDSDEAVRTRVSLGRASVTTIEVLEGLQPGDQVVLSDMSAWDAFDRVRLN